MYIAPVNSTSYNPNVKPKTGKKVAVGLSSLVLPGLGQGVNNQWGKASLMFLSSTAATIYANKYINKLTTQILTDKTEKVIENLMNSKDIKKIAIAGLGLLAIKAISAIDAVRNTKADIQ